MPITRKQFELEIDPKIEEWMEKIRDFLTEHEDEAFTEEELRQHYNLASVERLSDFTLALEKLVEIGKAEKRIIRGTDYYSGKPSIKITSFKYKG